MQVTPEMIEAWKTLQEVTYTIKRFVAPTAMEKRMIEAVDILDNSDFMVPIEEAGREAEAGHDCGTLGHLRCSDYTASIGEAANSLEHNTENGYDVLRAERPDPAEWGDTTCEDMTRHPVLDAGREAALRDRMFRP